ncbi:MAG: hypothetical protein ACE5J3_09780 [Methanosarcinales archaeon]
MKYEKVLGSPEVQKVLFTVSIYKEVNINQLCEITNYTRDVIYNILHKLTKVGVLKRIKRGHYAFRESKPLIVVEEVGKKLRFMRSKIEESNDIELEKIARDLVNLEKEYSEILKKEYNSEYTSLLQRCFYLKSDK